MITECWDSPRLDPFKDLQHISRRLWRKHSCLSYTLGWFLLKPPRFHLLMPAVSPHMRQGSKRAMCVQASSLSHVGLQSAAARPNRVTFSLSRAAFPTVEWGRPDSHEECDGHTRGTYCRLLNVHALSHFSLRLYLTDVCQLSLQKTSTSKFI